MEVMLAKQRLRDADVHLADGQRVDKRFTEQKQRTYL